MIHKHLDKFLILAQQIKEHGASQVYMLWQHKPEDDYYWHDCTIDHLLFSDKCEYRLKPKTRTINGMEYPEPLFKRPYEGVNVYYVSVDRYWKMPSASLEEDSFSRGNVQATEEGAKQMLAALQNALSGGKHE